ncbi:MAG: hypothetical protein Q4A31_09725 [Corynebacterium sp.]|uniref:hypothetical protein n=1 Tax=Corynebacterium sp. TaxID=1720 RepID=UPI0026DAE5C5|nr:hypothetical protein [Corynebacterium sp.]MDO4762184.1 hypothetical protein [Corynebacterium sp.]
MKASTHHVRSMTIAALIAGISGFVVIIVAARAFGDDTASATEFAAYWGFFFAITGILTGLLQETTRAVSAGQQAEQADVHAASPLKVGLGIAAATVLLVGLSAPLWISRLVSTHPVLGAALLAIGLGSYAIQATVGGIISGLQLWNRYATLIIIDTASRMIVAIIAWLLGAHLVAFMVITVLGALSWIVIIALYKDVRACGTARADVDVRQFLAKSGYAMAASGATAIVITGFPTIVQFAHPDAALGAAIVYAVILTRAPLLLPLQQFQSSLIVRFVAHSHQIVRAVIQPLALVWVIGLCGAGAAWLCGPWILGFVLPAGFIAPGPVLGVLTVGAACTASLMITGTAAVAVDQHRLYLYGWMVATCVAIGIMFLPLSLSMASCLALIIGPLTGLLVHVGGFISTRRTR